MKKHGDASIRIWVVLLAIVSSACVGQLDSGQGAKIDETIRTAVAQAFPLPAQVTIRTHVGDDLRYSTPLGIGQIVEFYRQAYASRGFVEQPGSQTSDSAASMRFAKPGEKIVVLDMSGTGTGSVVHIWLEGP